MKKMQFMYDKEFFVFPFAITWYKERFIYPQPIDVLCFHFLWWHWRISLK